MAQTRIYHGTTVTEFVARHFTLLGALALFLGVSLLAQAHAETLLGRAVGLFAFAATMLLWLALLFQCLRARPLTALMELLALVLLAGFGVVLAESVAAWWMLRPVALPVLCYMSLFLILDETGVSRRPLLAQRDYQIGLRLLCLLAALLLAYVLKT
jgi:hypothetical protein